MNQSLAAAIRSEGILTADLLKPWERGNPRPYAGHCYVASEAYYWIEGGTDLTPMTLRHEGGVHWWLRLALVHRGGRLTLWEDIDLTAEQFQTPVPYDLGVGRGFLPVRGGPSKRTRIVLERLRANGVDIGRSVL